MKTPVIIRFFILFPLIGIALPDAAFCFDDASYKIPQAHFVILGVLLTILLLSYAFKSAKVNEKEDMMHTWQTGTRLK